MAYPQLSGKMVRLNGVNQRLEKLNCPGVSWPGFWCRLVFRQNPESVSYPMYVALTNGGLNQDVQIYPEGWYYGFRFTTSSGYSQLDISTNGYGGVGPFEVDVVWDQSNVAFYLNGSRVCKRTRDGSLSSDSFLIRLGNGYAGWQPLNGDIAYAILHNGVPPFLQSMPPNLETKRIVGLAGTEFLKLVGLSESSVLCFWDFRYNSGRNFGSGADSYDLSEVGGPLTYINSDITYKWVDEIPLVSEVWLDCEYSPAQPDAGSFLFHARGNGGTEPYSYLWQVSFNQGQSWSYVIGHNEPDYTLDVDSPGTVWVRCQITDFNSNSDVSEIVKVEVYEAASMCVSIEADDISGFTPHTVTITSNVVGGIPDYTYEWYEKPPGDAWRQILGETDPILIREITEIGSWEYKCIAYDSSSPPNSEESNIVKVEVNNSPPALHLDLLDACHFGSGVIAQLHLSVTNGLSPFNYTIDWGDDSEIEIINTDDDIIVRNHTYNSTGSFKIVASVEGRDLSSDSQTIYLCASEFGGGGGGGLEYQEFITEYDGLVILKAGKSWSVVRDITEFSNKESLYYELFQIDSSDQRITLIPKTRMKESKSSGKKYAQIDLEFSSPGDYYLLISKGNIAKISKKYQLIKVRAL